MNFEIRQGNQRWELVTKAVLGLKILRVTLYEGLSTNYVILDEGGGTKFATTTKSYAFHKS